MINSIDLEKALESHLYPLMIKKILLENSKLKRIFLTDSVSKNGNKINVSSVEILKHSPYSQEEDRNAP